MNYLRETVVAFRLRPIVARKATRQPSATLHAKCVYKGSLLPPMDLDLALQSINHSLSLPPPLLTSSMPACSLGFPGWELGSEPGSAVAGRGDIGVEAQPAI